MKAFVKRGLFYGFLVLTPPAILVGAVLYYTHQSLGPNGSLQDAQMAGVLNIAGAIVALLLMLVGLVALIYVRTRRAGYILVCACLVFTVASLSLTEITWRLRLQAFADLVERSEPLIHALREYESIRQETPPRLDYLVPDYLRSIPATGIALYPEYQYETLPSDSLYQPNAWLVRIPLSQSPHSELLYLPNQDYDVIEYDVIRVKDWAFVYQEAVSRE